MTQLTLYGDNDAYEAAMDHLKDQADRLYDGNAPHVAGSETSKAAGESVGRVSMRDKVYSLISQRTKTGRESLFTDEGATDDELERLLRMRHQTASARRRELVLLGKVVDSGRTRKTRSGCKATVWVTV